MMLGIDPGVSGGLALVQGQTVRMAHPMPASLLDLWNLFAAAKSMGAVRAVIEKVHSSPQMGVVSAFTFGKGYGQLVMALTAAAIPFEEVRPEVWQSSLGIPKRKKGEAKPRFKERLRAEAQKRFPSFPLWSEEKTRGRQLAVADALLIALHCSRLNGGES